MTIIFLPSAARDLAWFRQYYSAVFPQGDQSSRARYAAVLKLLAANPYIGHPTPGRENVRELHISRTPFTLIYRVTETRIEVLRLWDTRQGGAP
ncbi:MAG: hypothetical protein GKR99_13610 [Rhodobacteraceae bacterium]|nr:hypothetical protein [Paracoccaceae bacterium]